MKSLILVFLMLIPLVAALDSEPPVVTSFNVKPTAVGYLLITWTLDDNAGLGSFSLYRDGVLLTHHKITGAHLTDLYQDSSFLAGNDYEYKMVVFDQANNSVEETVSLSSDTDSPEIETDDEIISNKKILNIETDEEAYCLFGYSPSSDGIILIEETAKKDHKVTLPLITEGSNPIYIKCEDEFNNEMSSFYIITFEYDITDPTKIKNENYSITGGKVQLEWDSADDENEISYYNIYDDQDELIDSTSAKIWMDPDQSRTKYYVAAVDMAGNEGGKTRIDVDSELVVEEPEEEVEEEPEEEVEEEPEEEEEGDGSSIVKITVISWIVFGLLLIGFGIWKIYEHRTDRHGLKSYMTRRRRVRNFRIRFRL
ncbi:hypothetical protein ACFLZ7_00505 [Nanoarchaeota archaeon]